MFIAGQSTNLPITFQVNNAGTTISPMTLYANGVVRTNGPGQLNKILVLSDNSASDDPSTATNFYGFGVNTNTLRYHYEHFRDA
jgi:hypothetical protein